MADTRNRSRYTPSFAAIDTAHRPRVAVALALLFTGWSSSCATYEPSPLDIVVQREAWHERTIEESAVQPFLDRFEDESAAPAGPFDATDGLHIGEGRLVALAFNPNLRLARLRAGRAAARAEYAGLWSDPRLSIDALRVAQSVPDPWVLAPSLTFTLPLSGRLEAQRELAEAQREAADELARESEWAIWCDVENAWIAWSAMRLRTDETERFLAALKELVERTSQLAQRGELPRTEARLLELEAAQRLNRLGRLQGEVATLEQRLRALLGLSPDAPVQLEPTALPVSPEPGGERAVRERITQQNPSLARLRRQYEVSEKTLQREIRKQYPDLTLGPAFESDAGQSRFGITGMLPLPFFNRNRQAIAAARAGREIARATYETTYQALIGQWSATRAQALAAAAQRSDLESGLVPLVDRQLTDALELLRLGEGSSLVLLESLTRALETKLDLIAAREDEALALSQLNRLTGPTRPHAQEPTLADPETQR